jgi:protease IV
MKLPGWSMIRLSREARAGIVTAALIACGAIALDRGWPVAGVALILAAAGIVALFYAFVVRLSRIPRDAILTIRIADGLREDAPRSPLERLQSRGATTLCQLRQALEAAAHDPSLKAVVVEISAPGVGLATAQELHDLLRAAVAAGRRVIVVASGDNLSVRDYLLASGAGEIIVNPDTSILMLGVTAGGMFLKNALSKIGIEAQTLQWKEYKGAAETFNRESMSPEVRESLEGIIGDWTTILAQNVATARGLSVERSRELIGAGFLSAAEACAAGLVDRAGYIEDLRDELEPGDSTEKFIGLARYLRHLNYQRDGGRRPRLALIHGLGPVVTGEPPITGEFLSGERVARDLRHAARDEQVRAIVFRINSPGGSAVGSDLIWRAVRDARKRGKPVVISMGDVAGSGGYYAAMGADAIVAEPSTITGSIGVVYAKFSIPALLTRLGIGIEAVNSAPISDVLSPARAMSEAELAQLNQTVGQLYANFTAKVAEGRGLDAAATEAAARGRVWSGVAAKEHGLVDELGGLARAIAIARDKAGIAADEAHELTLYPSPSLLNSLSLGFSHGEMPSALGLAASLLEVPSRWAPAMLHLMTRGGLALQLCALWR